MTFQKIMLLAVMAMATAAFAAPAAQADAPEWHHGEDTIIEEDLHITGYLSSTTNGAFISGPCEVTFEGVAKNENGMAAGTITGGAMQSTCGTSVATCNVTPTPEGFPWNLTGATLTEQPGVEIGHIKMTMHYEGTNCPVPRPTLTATGYATGIVDGGGCLSFEDHQDGMHLAIAPVVLDLRGTICDTTLTLG